MDVATGNAVGSFALHADATAAVVALGQTDRQRADDYAVLGVDEKGMSVGAAEYLVDLRQWA